MLPERDRDFAGKKALDGPGVKHFATYKAGRLPSLPTCRHVSACNCPCCHRCRGITPGVQAINLAAPWPRAGCGSG